MSEPATLRQTQKLRAVHDARQKSQQILNQALRAENVVDNQQEAEILKAAHSAVLAYFWELEPMMVGDLDDDEDPPTVFTDELLGYWDRPDQRKHVVGLNDLLALTNPYTHTERERVTGFLGTRTTEREQHHYIPLRILEQAHRAMNRWCQREGLMIDLDDDLPTDELEL